MAAPKTGGNTTKSTGRTVALSASVRASSAAVATLRASRAAKVASALTTANRQTGLFTKKK
ncbi:hypothetical protein CR162_18535 [Pseudoroseomonas rhizosphaerae]|uniref:Uncharacterized protein n=1 Tax=Teichococcus rhizosphaerae TaxID=1335062 RepID=A0A2C7A543_9PROT|nr:hypothetical protein [Pseudoroseomonas rhizosphaerae]PHK93470.1 hypothetical protein CR162_18535 [Pseudoroseomonas rhizosphaerae]